MSIHCINVYKGLRYTNSGDVAFCCKSNLWLDDKSGVKCKIDTHTFEDAINGKTATEIRSALENGIKHENCKKCWDEEDAGIPSKRILDNNRATEYWDKNFLYDRKVQPSIVELNLGTLCNLKCRICGPWSSSRWVEEHFSVMHHGTNDPNAKKNYLSQVKSWQGNYEDDSLAWKHIEESLPHLKQIDIYGGEPFLVEKQWEVLKKSVDLGYAKNQVLHFNTNATQYKEEHIDILKEFKAVLISLSLDGIEKRFEYQRHPAKWETVRKNIDSFLLLRQSNISVVACVTINTLNVYYLYETLKYFSDIGLGYYINILHGPPYYNIKNLPLDIKERITAYYSDLLPNIKNFYMEERIKHVLDFMNTNEIEENVWKDFYVFTRRKDDYRKERFPETFPEYAEVIDWNSNVNL